MEATTWLFSDAYCDYFKLDNLQLNLQLIPNYFKNEKFVKLNTIITNDNVHEEVKYFSCQTCDKSYTQYHNLKKHIKSAHEGVKKLSCKLCDKSYAHDHKLKNHIKTFHQGTKISCNSLDKSFSQSQTLKKHIKIIHEG